MAFQTVQPAFLKLVYAQFPELFDVTTLLSEEGLTASSRDGAFAEWRAGGTETTEGSIYLCKDKAAARSFIQAINNHIENPHAAVKGKTHSDPRKALRGFSATTMLNTLSFTFGYQGIIFFRDRHKYFGRKWLPRSYRLVCRRC